MPDFFGYSDPFTKAASAMPGRAAMPAGPVLPSPRPSIFDDESLRQLAAGLGTGSAQRLPAEMQPLGGDGQNAPMLKAMDALPSGRAGGPMKADLFGGMPTLDSRGGTDMTPPAKANPMMLSVGGGPAAPMPQAGDKDFVTPAPQAGTYYGPNNGYGMAPYRSDAQIKASGTGNVIQDRIMSLLNSEPPSPVAFHNAGGRDEMNPNYAAQMADRHAQFGTLNELMKGQNEAAFQDKHLALETRKQGFMEKEAGRLKGDEPRRQAMEDKMIADAMSKPGGATPLELATIKKQVTDAFPYNNPAAAPAGPGQAAAQPAGAAGDVNALIQKLPSSITAAGGAATTPEQFAERLYQLDRSGMIPKGTNIGDIMAYMNQKYPGKVEQFLKPPTTAGVEMDRARDLWGQITGDDQMSDQDRGRSAILNALGRKPETAPYSVPGTIMGVPTMGRAIGSTIRGWLGRE